MQHLDRGAAAEHRVLGEPHRAHATLTDLVKQPVLPYLLTLHATRMVARPLALGVLVVANDAIVRDRAAARLRNDRDRGRRCDADKPDVRSDVTTAAAATTTCPVVLTAVAVLRLRRSREPISATRPTTVAAERWRGSRRRIATRDTVHAGRPARRTATPFAIKRPPPDTSWNVWITSMPPDPAPLPPENIT